MEKVVLSLMRKMTANQNQNDSERERERERERDGRCDDDTVLPPRTWILRVDDPE